MTCRKCNGGADLVDELAEQIEKYNPGDPVLLKYEKARKGKV